MYTRKLEYMCTCVHVQFTMCIVTIVDCHNSVSATMYSLLHSVHQGSPTYGPRAKCGPFQKNNGPF